MSKAIIFVAHKGSSLLDFLVELGLADVPFVRRPLPDITDHVLEAVIVVRVGVDRSRSTEAVFT